MTQDDHRRYEEDLAAYLLDALESDEVREFRLHLEGCARCQREELWLRAAVEQLPSSVEQFEPAPALRKRLMGRVRTEAAVDEVPARQETPRRRRWALGLRPAAALATVAIVAGGLAGYLIGQDDGPTTTTIQAEATPAGAQASLVRTGNSAVLRVARLPVQRPRHVYKAWLLRGEQPEPSSLFVVGKDGSGSAPITGSLEGVDAVLVTEEPEGSTSKPTSKPVLTAKL